MRYRRKIRRYSRFSTHIICRVGQIGVPEIPRWEVGVVASTSRPRYRLRTDVCVNPPHTLFSASRTRSSLKVHGLYSVPYVSVPCKHFAGTPSCPMYLVRLDGGLWHVKGSPFPRQSSCPPANPPPTRQQCKDGAHTTRAGRQRRQMWRVSSALRAKEWPHRLQGVEGCFARWESDARRRKQQNFALGRWGLPELPPRQSAAAHFPPQRLMTAISLGSRGVARANAPAIDPPSAISLPLQHKRPHDLHDGTRAQM